MTVNLQTIFGPAISGRAVTDVLFVSPSGEPNQFEIPPQNVYTSLSDALDAASTDANDCTLILVSPTLTFYDIDRTGNPTWAGNYEIFGTHRIWAPVRNNHLGATSVMNFSGKAAIRDLAIFTEDAVNGVSFSGNGWRIRKCGFNSTGLTGAATSIHIDGSAALTRGAIMEDVEILGHVTHTTGIHIENSTINKFHGVSIHDCLVGILFDGAAPAKNEFREVDIGGCALGVDIDTGSDQHFMDLYFHENTRNVDDEVGDHEWLNIRGEFDIYILPINFAGVTVLTGAGNHNYGLDTELVALNAIDNPFRIVGTNFEPAANEWYAVRFTQAAGPPYYDEVMFDGTKREGLAAPSGTEHIFNADTRISCSGCSETGGNNVNIWVEIQEI